jgi:cytidine deaminase
MAPYYPELLICLCAAAGTDTAAIYDAIASELRDVGYTPVRVRLSALMGELPGLEYLRDLHAEDDRVRESQKAGNEIRRILLHGDAVVRLALAPIREVRESVNQSKDPTVPAERHCFIISSLKRSEELETLRKLFGQRCLLVSVYEPREQRIENLCLKIASSRKSADLDAFKILSEDLINIDQSERADPLGQRLARIMHHAAHFCTLGELARPDVPSGGIGVRQLVMQRVRG